MTTSEDSTPTLFDETELTSTSSAAGFPAKTLALLERELASRVSDLASGSNIGELLGKSDPDGLSLKTCQQSLLEAGAPSLMTLPRSGMIVSGNAYQRQPLARSTDGTDGGVWPTPVARDCRTIKGAARAPNATGTEPLTVVVGQMENTTSGALNPTWVEGLMGFPFGWSDVSERE